MKKLITAALIFGLFSNCTNSNKETTVPETATAEDTTAVAFFPVTKFLKGQLTELDSLQLNFLHTTTIKDKTDSVWEKKEFNRAFLKPFFAEEINETNLVSLFKSTKFNDQSINAVTFTYTPSKLLPDSLTLRHWDLYINPETGKVTKLYMVREINEGDIKVTLQLTWQTGKWAKIVVLHNTPDGKTELVKEDKLAWNFE